MAELMFLHHLDELRPDEKLSFAGERTPINSEQKELSPTTLNKKSAKPSKRNLNEILSRS
jgi:hypothetical protein